RPRASLRLGRVTRNEHAPGTGGPVGVAVVRARPASANGVAGRELRWGPGARARDVAPHDAAIVGRQPVVDTAREPQASRIGRALVERDEDRHHARHAGVRETVLVRTKTRAPRLLVVDLVLEGNDRLADHIGGGIAKGAVDQPGDAGVARGDVLGPADGGTGG